MSRKHIFLIFAALLLLGGCVAVRTPEVKPEASPSEPTPTLEDRFRNTSRSESGVPMLNKIPFINRLFMNTAITNHGFCWDYNFLGIVVPTSSLVSDDGNWLLVGTNQGGGVSLFSLQDPKDYRYNIVSSRNDGSMKNISYQPEWGGISYDGNFLDAGERGKDVTIALGSQAVWMSFTPDQSAFLVYRIRFDNDFPNTLASESMELFDRTTGYFLRTFSIEPGFQCAAVLADGEAFFCVGNSALESWNLRTGEKLGSFALPDLKSDNAVQLRCSPDNRFVFIAFRSGKVLVHDLVSSTQTSILSEFGPSLLDVSPDGRTLLVASSARHPDAIDSAERVPTVLYPVELLDCTIRLYEIGSWQMIREIRPNYSHQHHFSNVRFSSDATHLIARGIERIDNPKKKITEITIKTFLAQYDLSNGNTDGTWTPLEFETLPLHPEGKRLLDGRPKSGAYMSPYLEKFEFEKTQ